MVTAEELREKYVLMETVDLFEIATNKVSYTELANAVANEELKRRKISKEDIQDYALDAIAINYNLSEKLKQTAMVDLELKFKMLYFFILWLPKARKFYNPNFIANGYILKNDQSNYYSITGLISFIGMFAYMLGVYPNSALDAVGILFCCFVFAYLADVGYNRNRQIKNIQRAIAEDKTPWNIF